MTPAAGSLAGGADGSGADVGAAASSGSRSGSRTPPACACGCASATACPAEFDGPEAELVRPGAGRGRGAVGVRGDPARAGPIRLGADLPPLPLAARALGARPKRTRRRRGPGSTRTCRCWNATICWRGRTGWRRWASAGCALRGGSTEFESLRDYASGDDVRQLDWKATARRARLIVRNQEAERNQTVLLLLDCGRLMNATEDGVAKLDHAVNTALLLAHVALARGDRVGLCTFSGKVHAWLAPRGQPGPEPAHQRDSLRPAWRLHRERPRPLPAVRGRPAPEAIAAGRADRLRGRDHRGRHGGPPRPGRPPARRAVRGPEGRVPGARGPLGAAHGTRGVSQGGGGRSAARAPRGAGADPARRRRSWSTPSRAN